MKKLGGILLVVAIAGLAYGDPYVGATLSTYDIASSDVPGPQPIRTFPVPAAANWPGAVLAYDNYAEGLGFSTTQCDADFYWVTTPIGNANVTVHELTGSWTSPLARTTSTNNWHTNKEGESTDSNYVDDNRFPYSIPRPGRRAFDFPRFQIVPTVPTHTIGVFLPRHANNWQTDSCTEDHNFLTMPSWQSAQVYIHGEGQDLEDWTLAEDLTMSFAYNGEATYCPFLMVESNGTDKIAAVSILMDAGWQSSPTFGFMDIYVPEPATLLMLTAGMGLLIRRRRS